jgi:transcriptional regulator with XRE-family HTH domain
MTYGERLKQAMDRRSVRLGRDVTRLDISKVAGCSPQNVGMIINNSKGKDQRLSSVAHAAVAAYLKVSPEWLLNEVGSIEQDAAPGKLSAVANELGVLFDMIQESDVVRRAKAYNAASIAIMQVLQDGSATNP